jgi:glycerol-3-phosphate dehydrogenase
MNKEIMEKGEGFSSAGRSETVEKLENKEFDLFLNGCGIREAITALYASAAGLRVLLMTDGDFHQNLYPLASEENALVQSGETRKLLSLFRENSAHLMFPDEFLCLSQARGVRRSLQTFFDRKRERISLGDVNRYEPLLKVGELNSVHLDREYKLDPVRLLMAILKKASELGAIVLNHLKLESEEQGRIRLKDCLTGWEGELSAKTVKSFAPIGSEDAANELHLYVSNHKFRLKRSLNVEFDDTNVRAVRQQDYYHMIVSGGAETREERQKLALNCLNGVLPEVEPLTFEDIQRSFEVEYHPQNELGNCLVEVQGFFKQMFDINRSRFRELVGQTPLAGANFDGETAIHELIHYGDQRYDEAKQTGISALDFKPVFYRYGSDIEWLTEEAYQLCRQIPNPRLLWKYVEAKYLIENEMVCHVQDLEQRAAANIITREEMEELKAMGFPLF